MTARPDFGVDPDRDAGPRPRRLGQFGHQGEFGLRLDIDLPHPRGDGEGDLARGLSDPGKNDLGRPDAGGQGATNLPFRDRVRARPKTRQTRQNRKIGIGLYREGDERARQGRLAVQSLTENLIVPREGGRGIDIDGRADLPRDLLQRHLFAEELTAARLEMVHCG